MLAARCIYPSVVRPSAERACLRQLISIKDMVAEEVQEDQEGYYDEDDYEDFEEDEDFDEVEEEEIEFDDDEDIQEEQSPVWGHYKESCGENAACLRWKDGCLKPFSQEEYVQTLIPRL